MKTFIFALLVLSSSMALAAESSKDFCQRLYDRANANLQPQFEYEKSEAALAKVLASTGSTNVFADNKDYGIKHKMGWAEFKSYVQKNKNGELTNYYQAEYESAYFDAYCGAMIMQGQSGSADSRSSSVGLFDNTNPTFEKHPNPADHAGIDKEINGSK